MGNQDIELQVEPKGDGDKTAPEKEDTPPVPPKRDYLAEEPSQVNVKKKKFPSFPRPEIIYKPESTKTYMTCLKNLFILFNLLIWLFGAVLTGIGIWAKVDEDFWDIQTGLDMKQFSTACSLLIAVGVFIMLIGFFGCYGAFAETVWMLIMYLIIVILLITLEIAVAALVWSASNNKELKDDIKGKARKALQEVSKSDNQRYFLDIMQAKLKCCGIDGPDEYEEFGGIPNSCTNVETGFPYKKGCLETVITYLKGKAAILGGIAIGVFILQLAAIAVTIVLITGLRQAVKSVF